MIKSAIFKFKEFVDLVITNILKITFYKLLLKELIFSHLWPQQEMFTLHGHLFLHLGFLLILDYDGRLFIPYTYEITYSQFI